MSLSGAVEASVRATKLQNAHNVLILDIERMKGTFRWEHYRGFTVEGEFWDLSDYRKTLGRIPAQAVTAWPRTICLAWNWYGQDSVEFAAEWQAGGSEAMLRKAWDAYNKAQVVVGHNIDNFDTKKLKTAWRDLGLSRTMPFKSVDTLKVARREFGDESNTLDALCTRMGIVAKTDRYDHEIARAACGGNREAQRKVKAYNCGDIAATRGLYDVIRAWDPSHPHSVIVGETDTIGRPIPSCHACWGTDLEEDGYKLANLILYKTFRCRDCGAPVQGVNHARAAVTRGAR